MVIEEVLLAFQVETLDRTIPFPYAFPSPYAFQ